MVNGQHFGGTGYQLDGTDNRDPILGIIVINPNLESIGEVKVTSQNYDAEFGQATAGVVSVQTRRAPTSSTAASSSSTRATGSRPAIPSASRTRPTRTREGPAGDQAAPVRRVAGRARRAEPLVLLHRLPGPAQQRRRLAAPHRAHGARARRGPRASTAIDIHDPLAGAGPVPRQRHPRGPALRPGPRAPRASPAAQRARDPRQLPRPGLRVVRQQHGERPPRRPGHGPHERVRPLQHRGLHPRRARRPSARPAARRSSAWAAGPRSRTTASPSALDYALDARTVLDVRFGFFQYKVGRAALRFRRPRPAARRRDPRPEPGRRSAPACRRAASTGEFGFEMGSPCNCPLAQDEKQFQLVSNLSRSLGRHTAQDRRRRAPRLQPAGAERRAPLGRAALRRRDRTSLEGDGGLGLATFLLGDVTAVPPLRQHHHGRPRAAVAALLLRAGHLARDVRS